MTRIFDALKKAETAREGASPLADPGRAGGQRSADEERVILPLLGALEMGGDLQREMATLRVGIETALGARSARVVMFLGAQGGEGVSTVALQFAQFLAGEGSARPLLVDCHARRPAYAADESRRYATLDRRLGGDPAAGAVLNSNLFVSPLPESQRRAGVLQAGALRQFVESRVAGFDWVILDGPPVLAAPEASALACVADGAVIVLQAGRSKRPVLTRAANVLAKAGAHSLGSVLNRRVLEIPGFIYRRI
jgi:Mrp family chromosome partitioning ATPase